jgi:hypothetical protein
MSVVFPELSKNPEYPSSDGPDIEKAELVNDAKLGAVMGRERFESNKRSLAITFKDMLLIDKITVDNFARTVRTGVLFEFGADIRGNYYLDQAVTKVKLSALPEYKMAGYDRWDISMKMEVKGI